MTRLFIVSVAKGYGGAERSVEIIARHLPDDIDATIYAAHSEHLAQLRTILRTRRNVEVRQLSAGESVLHRRISALRLLHDFRRLDPAAVLVNTSASAILAAMVARYAPSLASRTALYVRDFFWHDLDFIFARLKGTKVLVPSAAVTDRLGYLVPFFLPSADAATIVPDMAELPAVEPSYDGPILHLATLNAWKGHTHLALAVQRLRGTGQHVLVHSVGYVGHPVLHRRLVALIAELGLGEDYRLFDQIRDPAPLLSACRAAVIASVSHSGGPETFGRTVIEAWAHRKPVVAFATGGPAKLIRNEVDGLLVPEGDVDALAAALWRLSSDAVLARRLGAAGFARVCEAFEAGAVTGRLLATLELR